METGEHMLMIDGNIAVREYFEISFNWKYLYIIRIKLKMKAGITILLSLFLISSIKA